jgi:hypothetical protein
MANSNKPIRTSRAHPAFGLPHVSGRRRLIGAFAFVAILLVLGFVWSLNRVTGPPSQTSGESARLGPPPTPPETSENN